MRVCAYAYVHMFVGAMRHCGKNIEDKYLKLLHMIPDTYTLL